MSMASSFYADYANNVKNAWVVMLKEALAAGDTKRVVAIVAEIGKFNFSE